jgi:hypothetical protein
MSHVMHLYCLYRRASRLVKQDNGDLKRLALGCRSLKEAANSLERSIDDVQRRLKKLGSRMAGAGLLRHPAFKGIRRDLMDP